MNVELTAEERAKLSAEDRALLAKIEAMPDPPDDDRFGGLLYDNVLGPDGAPLA